MTASPLRFPVNSLAHLSEAEAPSGSEAGVLAQLERLGFALGVLAVPAAVEESWYRLGTLPRRLAALYRSLDPTDPDEDILEEAWEEAAPLLADAFLLDDVVDALLEAFAVVLKAPSGASAATAVVRRQDAGGAALSRPSGRDLLLGLKRLYREAWRPERVAARLQATGSLALDPALALVHSGGGEESAAASEAASRLVGAPCSVLVDASGALIRVVRVAVATS